MTGSLIWLSGGMFTLIGILGLFMSSRAEDTVGYYAGLAVFVGAVLVVFFLIHRAFEPSEKHGEKH